MVTLKAFIIWLGILVLAIANGFLREFVLLPMLAAPAAFVLSGLLLSTLIICVAYLTLPWLNIHRSAQLWSVGFGWFALTILFEFLFGFWQGTSLQNMLAAYSFKDGNIWPVVLAVTASAPYISTKLRERA